MPTGEAMRIHEVAAAVGLTPRAIRFYEEQGLLTPSGRSSNAYRLFDADDVERLRAIKALRDDAGFSLAEIGSLLDDERARNRARSAFHATPDADERRHLLVEALERVDRRLALLHVKLERLESMVADTEQRRTRILCALGELEPTAAAPTPAPLAQAGAR